MYSRNWKDESDRYEDRDDEHTPEPIAVIGLSLKLPQDASTPDGFWRMMAERRSAMTDVRPDRYKIDSFYHEKSHSARGGHFVKDKLGAFDAEFFGTNPAEAAAMGPAQQMLLELTYKACENAGVRLEDLKGSRTSVHTGCFNNDYLQHIMKDPQQLPPYAALGATLSMLANRVSWFFDLKGPSVNVDSACSSSAMAIDQACQLLRLGQVELGIVAGCNLMFDPDYTTVLTNMSFLSPDSRSYAFDERANGYSRGEGTGVVLLKPLRSALRDNDTIRAVIRASGSNQDGWTPGITQPNSRAQVQLIRDTYREAGLTMRHTRFFEAHGTGTPVGDAAEANTITTVFQDHRSAKDPLYIGAVKSNIGHLEGGAGIAGLLKTILVLERGIVVPNANFEVVNPRIDYEKNCLVFPTKCVDWPNSDTCIRRASINCFGYGGSNCHLVVDDAYSYLTLRNLKGNHHTLMNDLELERRIGLPKSPVSSTDSAEIIDEAEIFAAPKLLVWSANDKSSLLRLIEGWQDYCRNTLIGTNRNPSIHDLAYTLDSRRSALAYNAVAIINSLPNLTSLTTIASEPAAKNVACPRLAFVFTGQGAQWYAMGRELLRYELFAQVVDDAELTLAALGSRWSVKDELLRSAEDSRVDQPDLAQPLTAILQIGLVDLLQAAGVVPRAVVGHSMGEIAAAYCNGSISRRSAFKLAYYRGVYVAKVPERSNLEGGMLAVGLSSAAVQPYFERVRAHTDKFNLMVSCNNSPVNITVSGEVSQLQALERDLVADHIFARRVRVSAAYHSPRLTCIAQDCLDHFGELQPGNPHSSIPLISTISGEVMASKELRQAQYWVENMISPVEYSQAIKRLCKQSSRSLVKKIDGSHKKTIVIDHIIEIGPHAALELPTCQTIATLPRSEVKYSSVLYRNKSASNTFLQLLSKLHCMDYPVDLRFVNEANEVSIPRRMVLADAPEYPFNHTRIHWHENHISRNYRMRKHGHVPLLGTQVPDWNPLEPQWRCRTRQSELPWLADHKIGGRILYPASAMLTMAILAASQLSRSESTIKAFVLRHVVFRSAIALSSSSDDVETRLCMNPANLSSELQPSWDFRVLALNGGNWAESCSGVVEVEYESDPHARASIAAHYQNILAAHEQSCIHEVSTKGLYKTLSERGFGYGPTFQGITSSSHDDEETAIGTLDLSLPSLDQDSASYTIHPASLDALLHFSLVALTCGGTLSTPGRVVTSIDKLWLSANGSQAANTYLKASTTIASRTSVPMCASTFAMDETKQLMRVILSGLKTIPVAGAAIDDLSADRASNHIFKVDTIPTSALETSTREALAEKLRSQPLRTGQSSLWDDYVLVLNPNSSAQAVLAQELRNKIGHSIDISSLADVTYDPGSSRSIISLLDIGESFLKDISESQYEALKTMVLHAKHVIWITSGGSKPLDPAYGMINGFIKVLRIEQPTLDITTLALDDAKSCNATRASQIMQAVLRLQSEPNSFNHDDYVVVNGELSVHRAVHHDTLKSRMKNILENKHKMIQSIATARPFQLSHDTAMESTGLQVTRAVPSNFPLDTDEVEIEVYCAGPFAIKLLLPAEATFDGAAVMEGAGIVKTVGGNSTFRPGERVCFCSMGSMKSTVTTRTNLVTRISNGKSFSSAAVTPAYALCASYLLHTVARLAPDDTVLIQCGQSPLDLAAITVATSTASVVIANPSTKMDEDELTGLGLEHVHILSHSSAFEQIRHIGLRKVDLILDLSDKPISPDAFDCLSRHGQLIRAGSSTPDQAQRQALPTTPPNVSFRIITLEATIYDALRTKSLCLEESLRTFAALDSFFGNKARRVAVSDLPAILSHSEKDAQNHTIVEFSDDELIEVTEKTMKRDCFDPQASYVIAGAFGDLGRCVVRWMVRSGARHLIMLSRSGPSTEEAHELLNSLKTEGVDVYAPVCNISVRAELEKVLHSCSRTMPPIKGCIQASGVLEDMMYQNMSFEDWRIPLLPKVDGSWNLHDLLPSGMDFFIMTSSLTGILGQATQINYAAANSYLDALAAHRVAHGEKSISLDLGALLTGGLLSQNASLLERFKQSGHHVPITEEEILALLEYYCDPKLTLQKLSHSQVIIGARSPADCARRGVKLHDAMQRPFWAGLRAEAHDVDQVINASSGEINIRDELQNAESGSKVAAIVTDAIVQRLAMMLSMAVDKVNAEEPFRVYGADSLCVIELRNWILKTFVVDVPVFDLLGEATIASIGSMVARKCRDDDRGK